MFARILVPLDGTTQSAVALPAARTLARATGAAISLVRVLPASSAPEQVTAAQHALDRVADELRGGGLQVDATVLQGEVAEAIVAHGQATRADLIAMRTHGRVGVARAVLGSVTQHVLADSRIPVLLLRPGGRRLDHLRRLLVPVDGSPGGALALGTAVGLAQATAAALTLLEVAVPVPLYASTGPFGGAVYIDPAWDEEALASARSYVAAITTRLRSAGLAAEGEARLAADVPRTIVEVAEQATADLIVMSTQALTGPARAVLGSVADAVVRSAQCPVLLIHRAELGAGAPPMANEHTGEDARRVAPQAV